MPTPQHSSDAYEEVGSRGRDADRQVSEPPDTTGGAHTAPVDRHSVVSREKERYGGVKIGSAFFGWLTATGTAVILTALLTAAGAAGGPAPRTHARGAPTPASPGP